MERDKYEEALKRRQEQHLKNINAFQNKNWQPCLHDQCTECCGTGIKTNGSPCVHGISCPCPKCTPYCMAM